MSSIQKLHGMAHEEFLHEGYLSRRKEHLEESGYGFQGKMLEASRFSYEAEDAYNRKWSVVRDLRYTEGFHLRIRIEVPMRKHCASCFLRRVSSCKLGNTMWKMCTSPRE